MDDYQAHGQPTNISGGPPFRHSGPQFFSPNIEAFLEVRQNSLQRLASLTERETDVLRYVVQGTANKVTARRLNRSIKTVEKRRHDVMKKLQVQTLADLMRIWLQAHPEEIGLMEPQEGLIPQESIAPGFDKQETCRRK